ncbi:MAG: DNA gyrase inhibitor YacG [Polyangiaceae bacterium]|jgi:endogenous inhibitor of DNA gyrase (YacG/DUF329 family)
MSECSICGRAFEPRAEGGAFPFCSARCKRIDLGKWLSADYRVPVPVDEDDADHAASEIDGLTETGDKS